jgi:hypothetical protein
MEVDQPDTVQQGSEVEQPLSEDDLTQGPGEQPGAAVLPETQVDQPSLASTDHLVDMDMAQGEGASQPEADPRHQQQEQQQGPQGPRAQRQDPPASLELQPVLTTQVPAAGLHHSAPLLQQVSKHLQGIRRGLEVQVALTPPSVAPVAGGSNPVPELAGPSHGRGATPVSTGQGSASPALPCYARWSLARYQVSRRQPGGGQWVLERTEPVANPGVMTTSVVSVYFSPFGLKGSVRHQHGYL